MSGVTHAVVVFDPYRMVVGRRHKHAIWRTRYRVVCACGWDVAGCDYITARRLWKAHK